MFRDIVVDSRVAKKIKRGYLWVTRDSIKSIKNYPRIEKGDVVRILDEKDRFVAMGYFNPDSYIVCRVYSFSQEDLNEDFIRQCFIRAKNYRDKLKIDSSAIRLFFSESDGIPGIIVDRYNDGVVFQSLTYGVEKRKDEFIKAIEKVFSPEFIVERRDAPGRQLEGLEIGDPVVHKGDDVIGDGLIKIKENGLNFLVDVFKGHKTGHYLDQRKNRKKVAELADGRRVLDAFCNTGGFGVTCAFYGAKEVVGVDISQKVLDLANKNAELNGVSTRVSFIKANVFDELRRQIRLGERYDMVILDPPSFVKSAKVLENAERGYLDINVHAIRLLKRGGILVTASCSHHFTLDRFFGVIERALHDAGRRARILDIAYQDADHPILPAMPETLYLKLIVMEVY